MKIKSAEFIVSAPDLASCPRSVLPEFALIGRSNVGKSSLVNLLTERRDLARVSDAPGKTQLINFFVINNTWCLVDLPGYGYANVGKQRRLEFNNAVADFISERTSLQRVFVLIDSRIPPQPIDIEFLQWLEGEQVPYAVIFTKTDKQSVAKGLVNVNALRRIIGGWRADLPEMFATSVKTRAGRSEVLAYVASILV